MMNDSKTFYICEILWAIYFDSICEKRSITKSLAKFEHCQSLYTFFKIFKIVPWYDIRCVIGDILQEDFITKTLAEFENDRYRL